ncbi:hypothetical protein TrRE_jg1244 [Triparma retinervis]|uniref:KIF-binding protein n=1 Tax=Triparma retinervis TaxID=2557542 RepID=A0A9W7A429_9STRA|nr:hypothetical protein TrRE_jg1244 [Triparma retinervis]
MTYDENEARTDRMMDKLQDLGLSFDPKTNSVTAAEGVDVNNLPNSIALNGAADGQGRWYGMEEFESEIVECDDLVARTGSNPKKPFQESYDARKKLEQMRVEIETKRCLAMVEGGKGEEGKKLIKVAQAQVGRLEYRLGKIALDCEEGSVKCLEHIVHGCFSNMFGSEAFSRVADMGEGDQKGKGGKKLSELIGYSEGEGEGAGCSAPVEEKVEALNTAAIAYANKEKLDLSLELLEVAELLYTNVGSEKRGGPRLESLHTSTLFFFAQVYGLVQNPRMSCLYCARTTHRQLTQSVKMEGGELNVDETSLDVEDWVKNVMTLAKYYHNNGENRQAEHCLAACGAICGLFTNAAKGFGAEGGKGAFEGMTARSMEAVSGKVEREKGEVYLGVLNSCSEAMLYKQAGVERGGGAGEAGKGGALVVDYGEVLGGLSSERSFMEFAGGELEKKVEEFVSANDDKGLYELGKSVFLAANGCIDRATKFFELDGFVTDHIELCLLKANAYKILSLFESEEKRKQAMNLKRVQCIEGLMDKGINETAYAGLIKTLVHEIGSGYMDMFDLKSERVEGKTKRNPTYVIKRAEAAKLNELCLQAVYWFSYFLKLYVPTDSMPKDFELMKGEVDDEAADAVLAKIYFVDVDETLGYLAAHFKIARLLSKVMQDFAGEDLGKENVIKALKRSLSRFDFIIRCVAAMDKKGEYGDCIKGFQQQLEICEQMKELLPQKIDRVFHLNAQFLGAA